MLDQASVDHGFSLGRHAAASAERSAAARARHAKRGGAGCEAAGLVPFKTSLDSSSLGARFVNLAPSACADRRVKRLKKSVWASGHLHGIATRGSRPPACWFVTLTYRPGVEWSARHVSNAIQTFRNWCQSLGVPCRYTWVAELQQRGAVHYHLLIWLPVGVRMPHWDRPTRKANGQRPAMWPHGMTNTQVARAGVGYLMKYLSKLGELTRFPKGLRLYGIGGLDESARAVRGWFNLPEWVKSSYGVGDVKRLKGRLLVCETGELLPPAFRVRLVPSGLEVFPLREIPPRFHDGAYSTFPRPTV